MLDINHENETSQEDSYFLKFQRFIKYSGEKNQYRWSAFSVALVQHKIMCPDKVNNVRTESGGDIKNSVVIKEN